MKTHPALRKSRFPKLAPADRRTPLKNHAVEALESRIAPAAIIVATLSDNTGTAVQPGGAIHYTEIILNNATAVAGNEAVNLAIANALDPNLTLVAGSLNISPLALDDTFAAVGNTQLFVNGTGAKTGTTPSVGTVGNLFANDMEFENDLGTQDTFTLKSVGATNFSGSPVTVTTTGGGSVTVNGDGSFSYVPAVGFTGADTFTYTLSDDGIDGIAGNGDDLTSVGTVTINVAGKVWYVDNSGSNGDGRSNTPFNSLAAVTGATGPDAAGDIIYINTGSGNYTGGITLLNNQILWGENEALVVSTLNLSAAGADPVITNAGGSGVTVAAGNTLKGFTIGDTTAFDIANTTTATVGTLTVSNVVLNGTGGLFRADSGGTLAVVLDSASTTSSAGHGIHIAGATTGTFTVSAGSISGVAGTDALISGGSATVSIAASITSSAGGSIEVASHGTNNVTFSGALNITGGTGISVHDNTGGTIAFTNASKVVNTGASTAVSLATNTGATINFSGGGLDIDTTTGTGFSATGGGNVNVTGAGNSITATGGGTGLNVQNTTIGSSGLTFVSISSTGGSAPGIVLDTTGSSGGLTVTGDGGASANGSGGTISGKGGDFSEPAMTAGGSALSIVGTNGIFLRNTNNVSLGYMNITGNNASGIFGHTVNGFVLNRSSITANGDTNGSNADELGVDFYELRGTAAAGSNPTRISNSTISNNFEFEIQVTNFSGTLTDFRIENSTVSSNGVAVNHGNLVNFLALGNASMGMTVTGGTFTGNLDTSGGKIVTATAIQADSSGTASSVRADISGASFTNNNVAISVSNSNGGNLDFDISGNTATGNRSHGLNFFSAANSTGLTTGSFSNNVVGTLGVANSGANLGIGIRVQNEGASNATLLISGNTVQEVTSFQGINVNVGLGGVATAGGTTNLTITNNIIREIDGSRGIVIQDNQTTGPAFPTIHATISGNSFSNVAGQAGNGEFMRVRELNGTVRVTQAAPTAGAVPGELDDANGFNDIARINISGAVAFSQGLPPLPMHFAPTIAGPEVVPVVDEPLSPEVTPEVVPPSVVQPPVVIDDGLLSQSELEALVQAAIIRWEATGLTPEQSALLHNVVFEVADFSGRVLGQATPGRIVLDSNGASMGWFVDTTPLDDSEFDGSNTYVNGHLDAFTTVLHELGHVLGLDDTLDFARSADVMYGYLHLGERRLPGAGQAEGAVPDGDASPDFAFSPINGGRLGNVTTGGLTAITLPGQKSITVNFDATVPTNTTATSVSTRGTITANGGISVLTDDPDVGSIQTTTTAIDLPDVSVAVSPATVTEDGAGNLIYTFTRTGPNDFARTVNFSVGGAAAFGTDYTQTGADTFSASAGTVTFAAGSATAVVTINPSADSTVEADEAVLLTVTSGSGYDVGNPAAATGTIVNDDTDVSVAVAPASVSEDGAGNLVYTFTRSGVTSTALTVNFNVGGTSTFSSDYAQTGAASFSATTGTVTFAAGATTATVTIDPTADNTVEADETAILTVATGSGYNVAGTAATGTINNDDADVTLAISPSSVTEDGAGNLVYTFTRTGFTTNALTVNFNVGGTATFNTDYAQTGAATFNATTGTVTFAAGSTTATVTLNPTTDTTVEGDETTLLTLASGSGYNVATPGAVTGTITNDDTDVSLAISPSSILEDAAGVLTYTFTRVGVTSGALTVNFLIAGDADLGADYTQTGGAFGVESGTVTFAPGATTATITIDPVADTDVEGDETVILSLSNGTGYTVTGPVESTGTILNDDTSISVTVEPTSVSEDGAGNLVYTFTRQGVATGALTVNFSVAGAAAFGTDYTQSGAATFSATTGTVSFAAGATTASVVIDPTADSTVESNEDVVLTVTSGTGYTITGTAATGTISNDDASVSLAISPASVTEDGAGNLVYTFTRTGFTTNALTVNFSVAGTAAFASDYSQTGAATFTTTAGTITFAAGASTATLTIDPTADTNGEPDETVDLTITAGSGYGITTTGAITGTILNDDTAVSVAVAPGTSSETTLTPFVYTFTRTGDTSTALTVNFNVGGTATLTSDYTQSGAATFTATSGTVVIPIGQSSVAVTLTPVNDTTAEASETAVLTVASGSGYSPSGAGATGTILDNDIDLQITKTDGVTTEIPGTSATYTIIVTNAGLSAVAGASIADTFAAILTNVSYTAVTAGGATGFTASGNGNINDTAVNMPAGATITYTVTGTIVASATGTLVNTATVTAPAGITDPNPGNNSATDTDTLTPQGDLAVTKTDGRTTLVPGTSNTYTIVVSNSGPSNVVGATLADTFPAGFTGVTFTAVGAGGATGFTASGSGNLNETLNLPSGATVTYTVTGNVAADATGSFANTATITAPGTFTDTNAGNNSATDTDTLTPQGDLSVTKTDGKTTLVPGTLNTYTIVVSNSGPSNVLGATLNDTFPAGLTGVTYTAVGAGGASGFTASGSGNLSQSLNLPAGASVTYTVTGTVSSAATGSFSNTATVSAPGGFTDTNSENNSATDTDTLTPQVDLAITKTDGKTTAIPGTANTYTITISNSGPSDAVGATLSDIFPAGFSNATYTAVGTGGASGFPANGSGNIDQLVNLPSGASITYTVSGTILASATGTLVNTATIAAAAGTTDTVPGNNSATDTDTLTPQADLAITKTDGVTSVVPGTQTTYTIVVSNSGPSNTTATVADTFPASLSNITFTAVGAGGATGFADGSGNLNQSVTLPSGGSITYTVTGTVNAAATGTLANTATVTAGGGTTDPNPGNNSATDTDTLTPQGDLVITKTDGVTTLIPGATTTYTITVSNAGPSNVVGANVSDTFAAILSNITFTAVGAGGSSGFTASGSGNLNDTVSIPSGGSITYTVTGTVASSATGTLVNTATVTAPGTFTDSNPGNNSATDTDTLTPQADLAVTKTDGPDPVIAGTNLTYTITLANTGLSDAVNVSLTDVLPAGTTFVSLTTPGGYTAVTPAVGAGGTVTISAASVPAGSFATFTLVALTSASVPNGNIIPNTAVVTSGTPDPNSENNSATATTTVATQADLSITKADSVDPLFIGSNLTYTLTAANAGASDAQNVTITDIIPAGMTFVSASAPAGWTATTPAVGANGTVTFTKTSFAAGGSESFTIVVAPTAGVGGTTISNTATIASATTDPTSENNSDTETTFVAGVDLTITKTDNFTVTTPGSTLTYVLSYSNAGSSVATGVVITETLPAGTTFSATQNPGWVQVGSTNQYTYAIPSVAAGASGTVNFVAVVDSVVAAGLDAIDNASSITDDGTHGTDIVPADNSATDTTTLDAAPDLVVSIVDDVATAVRGGIVTYTISYSNEGNQDATGVVITQTLPANTFFDFFASSSGWSQTGANTFEYTVGSLDGGGTSGSVDFAVRVASSLPGGYLSLVTTSTIADDLANGADLTIADNTDSESTLIYQGIYVVSPGISLPGRFAPPAIRVFDIATGTEFSINAYESTYRNSIRVATGDINGDGYDDIITSTITGNGRVRVFDGVTGERFTGAFSEIAAFTERGARGAFVASGDVTGDGRDDIIVGSGYAAAGTAKVRVFDGLTGAAVITTEPFGTRFHGGVRVAAGDVNGDGVAEIIASQGFGGNDIVVSKLRNNEVSFTNEVLRTIEVGGSRYRGGVFVAAAEDLNNDGKADLIVGRDRGQTIIETFNGDTGVLLSTITPFSAAYKLGVRVAAADVNLDGVADIIAGSGGRNGSLVKFFDGVTNTEITGRSFAAFPAFPTGAIFVAGTSPVPSLGKRNIEA